MKTLLTAVSWLVFGASLCAAQVRGAGGVTFVNQSGFGNVAYPGTGGPLVGSAPRYIPPSPQLFPSQLAATVNGTSVNTRPGRRNNGRSGVGYPVYLGGGYIPAYAPDYSGQTQLDQPQYQQPYQPPAPPVIINQYFSTPPASEPITAPSSEIYRAGSDRQETAEAAPAQKYYLLAFKDHSVYSALAYWIEDKTLHYVTPQNTHNQASLDLVDVDFTKKLNMNRDVPFTVAPSQ
jgi:hypothetical protein